MELAIFIVLTAAAGGYFTSLGCRRSQARHRRAGWHQTLIGTVLTALLIGLSIGQGDLFHPDRWDRGKVWIWAPAIMISFAGASVAFVTSVIVVSVFRAKFRNEKH